MSGKYNISYLADYPGHLDTIAKWYWNEWDRHEGWGIERSHQFAAKGMNKDQLDINMVAIDGDKCVGTIEIRKEWGLSGEEGEELNRYSPWLGSLFVVPEYRGGRLGFDLCKSIKQIAKDIGIKKCFAATSHLDKFFQRQGGKVIENTVFANEPMRIYEFKL